MEVHDRTLGFAGREVLFRPIEYERYRKPQVVEYPRHAVVLNPQHTRQQREEQQQGSNTQQGADSNSNSDEDEAELKKKEEEEMDDDDPRHLDKSAYLCSDEVLKQCMHLRWAQVGPVGVGLVNLGNTCFANAVLQAIAYTPALAQYFAQTFKAADTQLGAPYDFAYALGETIRQVHLRPRQTSGGAYRPAPVMGHLRALSSHFSIGRQSDAHEFAVQLLFACQKSLLFRQVGSKKLQPRVTQTTVLHRICGGYLRSQVAWRRQEEIQQLLKAGKRQAAMDLKIEGAAPGASDKMVSNTYDPSTILHVELAGHTLQHCLAKFCESETLSGRCYHTPRDVGVHATKQFKIHTPPNVLIIHLKRFASTGGKVSKYIQYSQLLDLTPFCTATENSKSEDNNNNNSNKTTYELNAICVHEGSSINYGHYYSVVRARNGAWYECNDSRVMPLSEEKAMRMQAYMLFYSRIQPSASSASSAKTAKKQQQRPGDRFTMSNGAAGPSATAPVAAAIGKELSEEEVAALLAARKASRAAEAAAKAETKRDDDDDDSDEHGEVSKNNNNNNASSSGLPKLVLKRRREDLSDESSEDDDEENKRAAPVRRSNGAPAPAEPIFPESEDNEPRRRSAAEASGSQPNENGNSNSGGLKRSLYGGVIKAMRGSMPARPAASDNNNNTNRPNVSHSNAGLRAVAALERQKEKAMPETVKRRADAPKFQQRTRDPLWEMEMDRGRVKKVKNKAPEPDPNAPKVNAFQEVSVAHQFDRRGRRIQRGGADKSD